MSDDNRLLDFAETDIEREIVAAVHEHGGIRRASRHVEHSYGFVQKNYKRVKDRAALKGWSPEHDLTHAVAPGQRLRGASTLYDMSTGEAKLQWVKSTAHQEAQAEIMRAAVDAMSADIPRADPVAAPAATLEDLANCYVVSDIHVGQRAWGEECGEPFDTDIAEQLIYDWFARAVELAPGAKVGILAQLGDLATYDSMVPETPASKHPQDSDSRIQKIVRVAIRAMRFAVKRMLEKHQHVHIIMADANHDEYGEVWMREWFAALYEDEPRVTVDTNPDTYYCYEHGLTAIYAHHGHRRKPGDIDHVFVAKFREVYGRTKYNYAHMGHLHHADVKETNLMTVEQHQALCARDSYATSRGYIADRSAQVITYSKNYGEVGRLRITPEMLKQPEATDNA